jgi:phosphatidylglycerophosphate synthase
MEGFPRQTGLINAAPAPLRIQDGILSAREKRLLQWLCRRIPAWVVPDDLTYLGLFGALMVFCGYAADRVSPWFLWLAIAGYLVNWFGDSLDGSLARYRGIERWRYGHFLDHSIDAISIVLVMLGIGLSGHIQFEIAMMTLVGYLLMCIHVFLTHSVTGRFRLTFLAIGPSELRLGLIVLTLFMFFHVGEDHIGGFSRLGLFLFLNATLLVGLFILNTFITLRELNTLDRPSRVRQKSNAPDYRDFWTSIAMRR